MNRLLLFLALQAIQILGAPINDLVFNPDGSVLASTGYKSVQLRSPSDASVQKTVDCDFPRVTSLAFHPQATLLAIGGGTPGVNGTVILLDWKKQTVLRQFHDYSDLVSDLAISSNGSLLAISSADHRATIHSLASSNTPAIFLTGHSAPVLAIAFSPQADFVATASADRSIKIWEPSGKLIRSFSHHTEIVHALAFRPGQFQLSQLASASADQTVRIWQPSIGRMVRIVRGHDEPIFALAYSPDGAALYSAGKNGVVRQLDTESDGVLKHWDAHPEPIYSMAISPDNQSLVTGDWKGTVTIWKLPAE